MNDEHAKAVGDFDGVDLIRAERARQVADEGWSPDHDDKHVSDQLAWAAVCYAAPAPLFKQQVSSRGVAFIDPWPWESCWDKRPRQPLSHALEGPTDHDRLRMLVKAGALVAAEIDRQLRDGAKFATPQEVVTPLEMRLARWAGVAHDVLGACVGVGNRAEVRRKEVLSRDPFSPEPDWDTEVDRA